MCPKFLIVFLTISIFFMGKLQASDGPELEELQKKLTVLEKEILDLKMKNVVENKFEWQFLKMTEIENDIKKLHNKFEILENNYYRELKKLKALVLDSEDDKSEEVDILVPKIKRDTDFKPPTDKSTSLDILQSVSKEEEFFMSALNLFEMDQLKLAEQRFTDFIKAFPMSSKLSSALFWRGEIRAKNENWIGAANDYLESFTISSSGKNAAKSLFGLGVSLGAIGEQDEACLTLEEVESRFQDLDQVILEDISKAKNLLSCDR